MRCFPISLVWLYKSMLCRGYMTRNFVRPISDKRSYNTRYNMNAARIIQNPFVTDELHKQPICRIMQGDMQVETSSGLHAAVESFKTCKDNLGVIYEAINAEKQVIASTLRDVRSSSCVGSAYVDEVNGMCVLDSDLVKCMPALQDDNIWKSYCDCVKDLNETFSNCPLPAAVYAAFDTARRTMYGHQHLKSSMGLVPNKRMADQSTFDKTSEFGSLSHTMVSSDPSLCLIGSSIDASHFESVQSVYGVNHPFYSQYVSDALHNLEIQAGRHHATERMDDESLPSYMHNPIIETARRQAPTVLHTGHGVVTIYKSTHGITHEPKMPWLDSSTLIEGVKIDGHRSGIVDNVPLMKGVYKTVADIQITTITYAQHVASETTGYLSRGFNPECKEHILMQHVNYNCTYHDKHKAHLPDVEFKIVTVNHRCQSVNDLSAVVHEFGNGPAVQFDISRKPDAVEKYSFVGFGISIASEVIHQSIINALHNIINKYRIDNVAATRSATRGMFAEWNAGDIEPLLYNLRKNIQPYDKKTDDPSNVFGKLLDASGSLRECGVIAYGSENREIGALHRADLVVIISPVAKPMGPGLRVWIPTWDLVSDSPPLSPTPSNMRLNSAFSAPSSSCGMDMNDIMFMASQPSAFDS